MSQPAAASDSPSARQGNDNDHDPSQYEMVEARHFNALEFKSGSVSKYSPFHVLDGEAYWYQHAPRNAKKYIPALLSCKIQVRD